MLSLHSTLLSALLQCSIPQILLYLQVRQNVLSGLEWMGVEIDETVNATKRGEIEISTPDSKVKVFVIPTNEELVIARDTLALAR